MPLKNGNIKTFVAVTQDNHALQFINKLNHVLIYAGFDIFSVSDFDNFTQNVQQLLKSVHCSIHFIGNKFILNSKLNTSLEQAQFALAKNFARTNPDFKIFIWRPQSLGSLPPDPQQQKLWFSILNNINENIILSTYDSPIMLVEDIRNILEIKPVASYDVENTDIYLIFNEIDEEPALIIADLLSDIASVQTTSVSLSSDVDYDELIVQQIHKAQLPIIFFKKASSWASYFIKEIWRKTGGLSSGKKFLLIGDDSIEENKQISFDAPNVQTIITSQELIPLEIKVALDKIKNPAQV